MYTCVFGSWAFEEKFTERIIPISIEIPRHAAILS